MSIDQDMPTREGPTLTDERGELREPYWGCQGCRWLRVHDFHYFYCRDLGDKSQPDFISTYTGGMKRLWTYPRPHKECRFMPPSTVGDSAAGEEKI